MRSFIGLSFFCFLAVLSIKGSEAFSKEHFSVTKSEKFDYLILREIWPASTCLFPGEHTCAIAKNVSTWVVHGLWPSLRGKIGPESCNRTLPFDYNKIKWLVPELLEFWPNLYTNTAMDSFWQHEWEKHGTCALTLPQVRDESDYFNVSLSLREHFDFGPILEASSIQPDDTLMYDLDRIKTAITKVLNVEPYVVCYVLRDSNVQYLSQMQICLTKEFELTDCSPETLEMTRIFKMDKNIKEAPQETQCEDGLPIHYPTIKYVSSLPFFKGEQNLV
jgi:ribonuclease T2